MDALPGVRSLPDGSLERQCTRCCEWKPATREFFSPHSNRIGLKSICKRCDSARSIAYHQSHPERHREYNKAWDHQHPDRDRQIRQRARQKEDPQKRRDRENRWNAANPDRLRVRDELRRARKLAAEGTFDKTDVRRMYEAQKGRCYYCHKKVGGKYHVDHVIPLSRGGSNGPSNLVIACVRCNESKRAKLPREWPEGGRLL